MEIEPINRVSKPPQPWIAGGPAEVMTPEQN
jgi:hypothetical protein